MPVPISPRRPSQAAEEALAGPVSEADVEALVPLLGARARERARAILGRRDLQELARSVQAEPSAELGLSAREVRRISAAFELGRRLREGVVPERPLVNTPAVVDQLLRGRLVGLEVETLWALLLDVRLRLRHTLRISAGTLTHSLVHPREVFRVAIREAAFAVVVAHNHPSGDPEPSSMDLDVTRRLVEAGKLLGIPLQDHVVIAQGGFVSLRERLGF